MLASKSFKLGEFKLSAGGTSDYYVDCRTTTLSARGAQLTGQVFQLVPRPGNENHILSAGCQRICKDPPQSLGSAGNESETWILHVPTLTSSI